MIRMKMGNVLVSVMLAAMATGAFAADTKEPREGSVICNIQFEQGEPQCWKANPEDAAVNAGRLAVDTTGHKNREWHRFLFLDPQKIGLDKQTCYSIEFDYEVVKSPSYFQLMERADQWRLLLNWSGPDGYKGKAQAVFTTDPKQARQLVFGMKNPGAIMIDNIVIRKWNNEKEAEQGLRVIHLDVEGIQSKVGAIKEFIGKLPADPAECRISSLIDRADRILDRSPVGVQDKIQLEMLAKELDREVYQLRLSLNYAGKKDEIIAFVDHPLVKIRCDAPYDCNNKKREAVIYGAGNEDESFQLVVVPREKDIKNFHIIASDLKSDDSVIGKDHISWKKVEYVNTEKELYPVEYVGLWPDPLVAGDKTDIDAAHYAQPFWITVHIPEKTRPGIYRGNLLLCGDGVAATEIPFSVNVWNFSLPQCPTFRTAFGGNWAANFYVKNGLIKPDRAVMDDINRKYRNALLDYRISPIRISREQQETEYTKVLIRAEDGSYHADHSTFDRDFNQYTKDGIRFNAFSFGTYWGWRNHLKGEKQKIIILSEDRKVLEVLELDVLSPCFNELMAAYFKSWNDYLIRNRSLNKAYYYIYDEPKPEEEKKVNDLLNIIHQQAPGLKTIIPGLPQKGHAADTFPQLDIMCPLLSGIDFNVADKLKSRGKESWWYVCLNPRHPYPNFFIDYPALDHRIIFWMSWKYKVEGLLYWQTTYWNVNPWMNAETYPTTHGDGCLFYPGKTLPIQIVPTIRLEVIRDGIEDYEYFTILEKLLADRRSRNLPPELSARAKELLQIPASIVSTTNSYTQTPEDIIKRRILIGNTINEIENQYASAKQETDATVK